MMSWKNEPVRHGLASKGVKTAGITSKYNFNEYDWLTNARYWKMMEKNIDEDSYFVKWVHKSGLPRRSNPTKYTVLIKKSRSENPIVEVYQSSSYGSSRSIVEEKSFESLEEAEEWAYDYMLDKYDLEM